MKALIDRFASLRVTVSLLVLLLVALAAGTIVEPRGGADAAARAVYRATWFWALLGVFGLNLACSMVHDPKLLLLDEPTVGIDPMLRLKLWDHFARMNAAGTTMLVTTHVMEEAERCHRVAMIADGRVVAIGTPAELREAADTPTIEEAWLVLRERHRNAGEAP